MVSKSRVTLLLLLTVALVGGLVLPAHAARPPWAGKPHVETEPVVDSDPPTFLCDGREFSFSAGEVTFREKEQRGGGHLTIQLRNAEATDGETTYRAQGGGTAHWRENPQFERFQINITFVGPHGDVERVRSTYTLRDGEESLDERGTCTLVF
ncbi:MAG TPA: hypothetical protein VM324_11175 [Egibacteraceae bacterium]|jgi:hypothetical protein|nr:hypothetical protein [Egibacteraceae bacterium]